MAKNLFKRNLLKQLLKNKIKKKQIKKYKKHFFFYDDFALKVFFFRIFIYIMLGNGRYFFRWQMIGRLISCLKKKFLIFLPKVILGTLTLLGDFFFELHTFRQNLQERVSYYENPKKKRFWKSLKHRRFFFKLILPRFKIVGYNRTYYSYIKFLCVRAKKLRNFWYNKIILRVFFLKNYKLKLMFLRNFKRKKHKLSVNNFVQVLNNRLDFLLLRLSFFSNIKISRAAIRSSLVFVNFKVCNNPGFIACWRDLIFISIKKINFCTEKIFWSKLLSFVRLNNGLSIIKKNFFLFLPNLKKHKSIVYYFQKLLTLFSLSLNKHLYLLNFYSTSTSFFNCYSSFFFVNIILLDNQRFFFFQRFTHLFYLHYKIFDILVHTRL